MFPKPAFFSGCELNFAENLLYPAANPPETSLAIIGATENTREKVTWATLRTQVAECAAAMEAHGLQQGERVAGYMANTSYSVVAMLAATSLGAIWSAVVSSPPICVLSLNHQQRCRLTDLCDRAPIQARTPFSTDSVRLSRYSCLPTTQ